jgi:hypothetical protein
MDKAVYDEGYYPKRYLVGIRWPGYRRIKTRQVRSRVSPMPNCEPMSY